MAMALVLFTECLDIRFAVRIEEFLAALLPRRSEFGRRDVPVWPAFLGYGTQVLPEIFQSGPTEGPIAVVHLINDKAGFKDNHVGHHRIVGRIGVFRDVEIFLDDTPRIGEERNRQPRAHDGVEQAVPAAAGCPCSSESLRRFAAWSESA